MGEQYNIKILENLPDDETLMRMARCLWRGCPDKYDDGVNWWRSLFNSKEINHNFVIITDETSDINDCLGHVVFFQNSEDTNKWLISNLKTYTPYRRNGIAYRMLTAGIERIKSMGGGKIYAFIDKDNIPSINLHIKLGFANQESIGFDGFNLNDNEIQFELKLNV